MTDNEYLNQKYSAFWVVLYNPNKLRFCGVGEPRKTIEEALKACYAAEKRNPRGYYGIDVRP